MSGTFFDRFDTISVAVAFDKHSIALTRAMAELCQRTGKKLCLLHVVEPWTELPHSRPLGANDPLWDVTQAVERNARDLAGSRLEELSGMVPEGVPVSCRVAAGKPLEQLGPEALAAGSCLLAVAADFGNLRFLPRGLSTALSLLVSSPVPVAVLDTTMTTTLLGEPATRLMLADDLGAQSETALEFAFGLGAALGRTELRHVHVNPLTLDSLRGGLLTAAATAHATVDSTGDARDVHEALVDELRHKLEERATGGGRDYLEAAGGVYVPEVVSGNVIQQIEALAAETEPHLLVFGRHHAYYTKPFFIGRLPYRSMLAQRRPIIVVPNE